MDIQDPKCLRAYARIDLDVIERNFLILRKLTKARVCCVVKANAYGHGAVELGKVYQRLGADFLAVSNIDEALQLRGAGVSLPILVLGYTPPVRAAALADNAISQCVYSKEYGRALAEHARREGCSIKIHIKLDTGMGRIGFACRGMDSGGLQEALETARLPEFETEGVFTHFSVADEGEEGRLFTKSQFDRFIHGVGYLEANGVEFQLRHCANSAAVLDYPQYGLDMVRIGIALYGLRPSGKTSWPSGLEPAMSFISVVSHIHTLRTGESVGYGRTFVAPRTMAVATVPVGYADGLWRGNGNGKWSLAIHGKEAPILGRICMDQLMADVTGIDCHMGDKVLIWGQGANTVDRIAALNGTINYEMVCDVGARVPRVYTGGLETDRG